MKIVEESSSNKIYFSFKLDVVFVHNNGVNLKYFELPLCFIAYIRSQKDISIDYLKRNVPTLFKKLIYA